uniref:Syndetin C-terminal domain-containing protein n=1 Tax=Ciona savignyi TaxID=51511 RepID=H2YKF9_CIOSA
NPQIDRETIDSINEAFFITSTDPHQFELEAMPDNTTMELVEARRECLQRQQSAVSKKLSDVILHNQPSYIKELKQVQELQKSLHNAFVICSNGRRYESLMSVGVRCSTASLALLSNQQKRQSLYTLWEALQTIKTLQHSDVRLTELMEEEDYAGAIQLCLECQQAAATYKHYHCIKDLSAKLQDTLELIEEQIDVALSRTCRMFDSTLYSKLQQGYQLLGKTQSAVDQLLMHYTACIHNTAFQVLFGFAQLNKSENNLQKKQYKDICSLIDQDFYIPCLLELCKGLWAIMHCYHNASKWHKTNRDQLTSSKIACLKTLLSSSVQSLKSPAHVQGPVLTNTALHVLRLCGSYLKMCDVLKPIALDVVMCMSQLFDLYFHAVYSFFSTDEVGISRCRLDRLHSTVSHIETTLFTAEVTGDNTMNHQQISPPNLSPAVDLHQASSYYGITERIVATESLVCLASQFELLHPNLEEMIPALKKAFLQQFYSQTVRAAVDVRVPSYLGVAVHAIDAPTIVAKMSMVKWDVREIMSQHNAYVDLLLNQLTNFKTTLFAAVRTVVLPEEVVKVIWHHCIAICNQVFVEGFSNVKKCSNEGRALMQLDYQQFLMKLEKLTNIRPIPHREYVELYIKAYYLTESDLHQWVQQHAEYDHKQLTALLS